jgi:lipid-A-disaccharide synthase-like uncharacterized protein
MRSTLVRASTIGVIAGVVGFILFAAFFAVFLLILAAVRHNHPDIMWSLKIAVPLAVLTAVLGFVIAIVRLRTIDKHKKTIF